jgi:sulfopropanediol 3-dehydrogenase
MAAAVEPRSERHGYTRTRATTLQADRPVGVPLRNYGSAFLGARATVAFSDKANGTNHTLPTGRAARYNGGLSVAKFLKTLTYQRVVVTDDAVAAIAPVVAEISRADLMPAHQAMANLRLRRLRARC